MNATLQRAATAAFLLFQAVALAQTGALENPSPNGIESGIGAISGWHCTGENIEIRIDSVSLGYAGSGTSRKDTQAVCGRSDTGFSLLFNYNLLSQGTHRIEALADGVLFANSTFRVGTLGAEFLTNLTRPITVSDFPARGSSANLRWVQSKQNFVIEGGAPTHSMPLAGSYVLSGFSMMDADGMVVTGSTPGVTFEGTMEIRPDGTVTKFAKVTSGSFNESVSAQATYVDHGYYVDVSSGNESFRYAVLSRGNVLTMHTLEPPPDAISTVEVWTRTLTAAGAESPASQAQSSAGRVHSAGAALHGGLLGTIAAKLMQR